MELKITDKILIKLALEEKAKAHENDIEAFKDSELLKNTTYFNNQKYITKECNRLAQLFI